MSKVSVTSRNVFRMSGSNDEVKTFYTQNKGFAVGNCMKQFYFPVFVKQVCQVYEDFSLIH